MRNFILLEISEDDPVTFLVRFVPENTENQAITYIMQTKSLQFIMYILLIQLIMIQFLRTVSSYSPGS